MKTTVLNILKEKRKALVAIAIAVSLGCVAFSIGKKRERQVIRHSQLEATAEMEAQFAKIKAKKTNDRNRAPAAHDPKKPESKPKKDDDDRDLEREVDEDEIQIALTRDAPRSHANTAEPSAPHEAAPSTQSGESVHESMAQAERPEDHRGFFQRLKDTYFQAFVSVHEKVVQLHQSEEENRKLRLENAHLRVLLETRNFDCRVDEARKHAEKVGQKLNAETGTRVGRTLASIQYQIPENLLPEQLHALGVSYLKAGDYERAATILTFLTELEGDRTFHTAENFLMTGIAWYKLENYKTASQFFDRALNDSTAPAKAKTQARVWSALVAQKKHDYAGAQEWLRHALEHDPQSREAHWVNPQEGERRPAAASESSTEDTGHEAPPAAQKNDEHANHH